MVSDAGWIEDDRGGIALQSEVSAPAARGMIARLIDRSRAEGAAAERKRVGADISEAHSALHEWEQQAGPGHPLHGAVSRAHEALHRTAFAMPVQQPRDLAGRIRALVQEHAGRWADAHHDDARSFAYQETLRWLRNAYCTEHRNPTDIVRILREHAYGAHADVYARAADELEAIVRECGGARGGNES
jgi:hypothetical protein